MMRQRIGEGMRLQLQTYLHDIERGDAEATNQTRDTAGDDDLLFRALNR
jgi:hypothetical protein